MDDKKLSHILRDLMERWKTVFDKLDGRVEGVDMGKARDISREAVKAFDDAKK